MAFFVGLGEDEQEIRSTLPLGKLILSVAKWQIIFGSVEGLGIFAHDFI